MLREIINKTEWQKAVEPRLADSGGFLQSWDWGEFQKTVHRKVFRFAGDSGACQVIEQNLPVGKKYWFIPKAGLIDGLTDEAKKQNVVFVRFEPEHKDEIPTGAQKTIHVSPRATLIIDLTKTEDELLAEMHEKTRYNIRLAAKKGVVVKKGSRESFENFWQLMEETGRRDKFRTHSKFYYQKMIEMLGASEDSRVSLWQAGFGGKILAAGLWAESGGTITYLHGASSSENRNLMAPYLLHWLVMKDAKSRGLKKYDLWGLRPASKQTALLATREERVLRCAPSQQNPGRGYEGNRAKHPWDGITRFKLGFGGSVQEYPGTYDLSVSDFWYKVYGFLRKVRRRVYLQQV